MNFEFDAIMILALFTLGAGLVIGIISLTRTKKAQDNHEDAAVAERQRHEDPREDLGGTPGNIDPTVSDPPASRPAAAGDPVREGDPADTHSMGRTWSEERGANPPTPPLPRN